MRSNELGRRLGVSGLDIRQIKRGITEVAGADGSTSFAFHCTLGAEVIECTADTRDEIMELAAGRIRELRAARRERERERESEC